MSLSGIGYNSTTDLYALEAEKKESTASKADKVNASTEEASKTETNKNQNSAAVYDKRELSADDRKIRRSARAS